jgi:hypothetical protein
MVLYAFAEALQRKDREQVKRTYLAESSSLWPRTPPDAADALRPLLDDCDRTRALRFLAEGGHRCPDHRVLGGKGETADRRRGYADVSAALEVLLDSWDPEGRRTSGTLFENAGREALAKVAPERYGPNVDAALRRKRRQRIAPCLWWLLGQAATAARCPVLRIGARHELLCLLPGLITSGLAEHTKGQLAWERVLARVQWCAGEVGGYVLVCRDLPPAGGAHRRYVEPLIGSGRDCITAIDAALRELDQLRLDGNVGAPSAPAKRTQLQRTLRKLRARVHTEVIALGGDTGPREA